MNKKILTMSVMLIFLFPTFASADVVSNILNIPFGGRILSRSWQVCLIPVPPPVFFVPIPYLHFVIGAPRPGSFEYWFGISKKYRRGDLFSSLVETAWALGIANPIIMAGLHAPCANRGSMPASLGVITKIGNSCPNEQYDECEK